MSDADYPSHGPRLTNRPAREQAEKNKQAIPDKINSSSYKECLKLTSLTISLNSKNRRRLLKTWRLVKSRIFIIQFLVAHKDPKHRNNSFEHLIARLDVYRF